jgi:hypothetical protein
VVMQIAGKEGVIGSQVRLLDKAGKLLASQHLSGGDGRGGQAPLHARFALQPGDYKVEVRYSSGVKRVKEINVANSIVRGVVDEQTPKAE